MMSAESLKKEIILAVFGKAISLDAIEQHLIDPAHLPKKVKSFMSGKDVWASDATSVAYADQDEVIAEAAKHDWLQPKTSFSTKKEFEALVQKIDFAQASRSFDSEDVVASDDVARSEHVYNSQNIVDSKNIVACSWIWDSEKLFGCVRSGASENCIGLIEGVHCSNSYRVLATHKANKSMFIKNCYDVYECLFCSHLQHKKYCIANMQFEPDEYFALKEKILGWIF